MKKDINEEYEENDELENLEDLIKQADEERNSGKDDDKEEITDNEEDDETEDDNEDDSEEEDDEKNEEQKENENDDKEEENKNSFEPLEIEVAGHKIKFNSKEELVEVLKKGAESLNNKKEKSKEELALEQAGLSADEIALFIDAKNGDKNALAKIANIGKIDLLDVTDDDANAHKQNFKVKELSEVEIVASSILEDKAHHQQFLNIASGLPQSFTRTITSNANDLRTFSEHVKSGLAQEIIPEALKLSYTGKDFGLAYVEVGTRIMTERAKQKDSGNQQQQQQERQISDREKKLRDKAKEQGSSNTKSNKGLTEDDIWNMTAEEFQAFISKK